MNGKPTGDRVLLREAMRESSERLAAARRAYNAAIRAFVWQVVRTVLAVLAMLIGSSGLFHLLIERF